MSRKKDNKDFSIVDSFYEKLKKETEKSYYALNEDVALVKDLAAGLLANQKRFGYQACPCRLAAGKRDADLDIICPCDYRDSDLTEYGACYCGLYVDRKRKSVDRLQVPERRGQAKKDKGEEDMPVFRCNVCGYLCARDKPPIRCPICGADADRFSTFELRLKG